MRFKRPVAAGLAAVIFAGNMAIPGSILDTVVKAAGDYDVTLKYTQEYADDAEGLTSSIVTGGSVALDITKPSGYTEAQGSGGLKIVDNNKPSTGSGTSGGYEIKNGEGAVEVTGNANRKTLNVLEKFFENLDKDSANPRFPSNATAKDKESWKLNLSVSGNYDALLSEGSVREVGMRHEIKEGETTASPVAASPISGTFTANKTIAVLETSTITVECTKTETANNNPEFKVVGVTDGVVGTDGPTYAFETYDDVMVNYRGNAADAYTKQLEFTLRDLKGSNTQKSEDIIFYYTPQTWYTTDENGVEFGKAEIPAVPPSDGNPGTPAVPGTPPPNSFVQVGTRITFTINKVTSNNTILSVYSPWAAAAEIRTDIEQSKGELIPGSNPAQYTLGEFIHLKEGDILNFIRQDFEVAHSLTRFHSTFYLEWEWMPDGGDELKDVVVFTDQPTGFQTVTLHPRYNDVKGKLIAHIKYNKPTAEVLTDAVVEVTIKGLGDPARLNPVEQGITKRDPATNEKEKDDHNKDGFIIDAETNLYKMPTRIRLDAYDGILPESIEPPKDPYQYTINLYMGKDSASSQYAVVECVEGDSTLVTMQTTISDGAENTIGDYQFGGQIDNPKREFPSEPPSNVHLTFKAVKTGVKTEQKIKVKVTFYVLDGQGRPVEAVTQPVEFEIVVKDSSPNSNTRLESLKIISRTEKSPPLSIFWPDLEKEDVGYTFSPDQREYSLSLPYKYQSVKITPTREDQYASKLILVKAAIDNNQEDERLGKDWIPDKGKAISIKPIPGKDWEQSLKTLKVQAGQWVEREDGYYKVVASGTATEEIPLVENEVVQITTVVIAEDESKGAYNVGIMRKPVGTDARLKSFKLTDDSGNVLFDGIVDNQFEYPEIEIPFKVQWIKVEYEMNDPMVTEGPYVYSIPERPDATNPEDILVTNDKLPRSEKVWINVLKEAEHYDKTVEESEKRRFKIRVKTYAEDYDEKKDESEYTTLNYYFNFHRSDPSEVNTLSNLTIIDVTNDTESNVTYTPTFHKNMESSDFYEVHIPYSVKRIKIAATADDSGASVYLREPYLLDSDPETGEQKGLDGAVIDGRDNYGAIKISTVNGSLGWMRLGSSPSRPFVPRPYKEEDQENTFFTVDVEVWPESLDAPDHKNTGNNGYRRPAPEDEEAIEGELTANYKQYIEGVMKYPIHIYRDPASTESSLLSIEIKDQDGTVIPVPDFNPDELNYEITVPFETAKAQITPTATDPNVYEIRVNNKKVASGSPSSLIRILHPNPDYNEFLDNLPTTTATDTLTVVVYPEIFQDATTDEEKEELQKYVRTYTFKLIREEPSDDCLLIKLEAGNTDDFKPVFAPMRTDYSAKVAEGAEGITLTPTANHKGAKIEIDGKRVNSGETSELIHILTVNQTVEVKVTAQDGKTTKTYRVRYQNPNLIEKTSNADLSNLEVEPGYRRPVEFDPSVTEYQVAVDEDTFSVRLIPTLADPLAKMQVFRGSQEIGDEDGNYAAAIADGENVFTIEVTSPDETKKKTYTVTVYRGDEENMGKLTPIHAEDIDFENSPDVIIVDVTKYPRIARDVFEELKNYPDKKIIFQGNDYSLQFDASDIDNVIPQTEYFSFGMSFRSPLEVEISDEIYSHPGNDDANLVFVYFDYHGALPGPAVLTLSMGSKYKNSTYYWNYYNEERERVDYYGTVNTNSKGTFSLIVDHLSTYIISDQRLNGANDASTGETIGPLSPYNDNDLGAEAVEKKLIPNTGAVKIIGGTPWKKGETE